MRPSAKQPVAEVADDIQSAHQSASRRWRDVEWPEPAFRAHVSLVEAALTADLAELFLSGAAAFRSTEAWGAIDGLCREALVRSIMIEYELDDDAAAECWHGVYIKMCAEDTEFPAAAFRALGFTKPPGKLIRFRGESKLETYLKQSAKFATLDLLRKRRAELRRNEKYGVYISRAHDQAGATAIDPESGRRLYDGIRQACAAFDDDAKRLFLYVHVRGMTRRDAAALLGWGDPSKATRRLQAMEKSFAAAIGDCLPAGTEGLDPSSAQRIFARAVQAAFPGSSGASERNASFERSNERRET